MHSTLTPDEPITRNSKMQFAAHCMIMNEK